MRVLGMKIAERTINVGNTKEIMKQPMVSFHVSLLIRYLNNHLFIQYFSFPGCKRRCKSERRDKEAFHCWSPRKGFEIMILSLTILS